MLAPSASSGMTIVLSLSKDLKRPRQFPRESSRAICREARKVHGDCSTYMLATTKYLGLLITTVEGGGVIFFILLLPPLVFLFLLPLLIHGLNLLGGSNGQHGGRGGPPAPTLDLSMHQSLIPNLYIPCAYLWSSLSTYAYQMPTCECIY